MCENRGYERARKEEQCKKRGTCENKVERKEKSQESGFESNGLRGEIK